MGDLSELYDALFDRYDVEGYETRGPVTCKRCGKRGLEWEMVPSPRGGGKWRLFEGEEPHVCAVKINEHFEDIS